jgi:hypothetical protein
MSLIPEFELGLWNAWIITVLGFILPNITSYVLPLSYKEVVNKRMREIKWSEFGKTVKIVLIINYLKMKLFDCLCIMWRMFNDNKE